MASIEYQNKVLNGLLLSIREKGLPSDANLISDVSRRIIENACLRSKKSKKIVKK